MNLPCWCRVSAGVVLAAGLLAAAPAAWGLEVMPGVEKVRLANGLTAVVQESRRAPVAAVQVWVKAGSAYESDAEAGITHLIEHMIFKGTERRGPGELARLIESVGGSINAYTSLDYTVYHCVVPREHLDAALDVLADAVFHAKFDPAELEREKKVVLEEIHMREDQPRTRLSRLLLATAYRVHPYRRPVIGFPKTVRRFTRADILAYRARRYRPSQMAVVVAGDVDAARTLARIDAAFGRAPAAPPAEASIPDELPQAEPRLAREEMDIQEGYLALGFSGIPGFNAADVPALDVLAALLADGESSRLNVRLRDRDQLVHAVDASAFTPAGPGLFEVTAALDPEKVPEALSRLLEELFRLKSEKVLDEEVERAKVRVRTDFVKDHETMQGEARNLGLFETLAGDPAAERRYLEAVDRVGPDDIRRLAEKYFRRRHLNVAMVLPKGADVPALSAADLGALAADAEDRVRAEGPAPKEGLAHPVVRRVLPNGLTVLVREAHEVPSVSVRLVFPGGTRYETKRTNGLFTYLARCWTRGTEGRSARGFAEAVERLGGSVSGFSGWNTFGLQADFLASGLDKGLSLFAEAVLAPAFSPEEVERLRPQILSQISRQEDYLPSVAIREFRRLLFSPHPYGLDPVGRPAVVRAVTAARLRKAYREFAVPSRGVLSIVGDVRTAEVLSEVEALFGGWGGGAEKPPPELPAPEPLTKPRTVTLKRDKEQVHIVLGFPGATFRSPDRFPLEVLSAVLSGQGGRLFRHLRDEQSFAYAVTSFVGLGVDYGSFACYIATAPGKRDAAVKALWAELLEVARAPVSRQELDRAKEWITGNYEIGLQTNGAQAMDLALNELYGLGYNFGERYVQEIRRVDAAAVQAVARRLLDPDAYVLVRVGP
ncbi:insulinase family protein [Dissulfurirhabdus thermomarina]|uniref:Insulinase family protein n=1 Tax=Dissulfurirhabdus thermomarina TaxID=1765737 RepID=A0A6N9TJX2_DISTH|nr:pitrilysin family protein [Dissulfurirhabdus thermomarina]NDY41379.1 insulinase family protein [Dissulfurirhabdus thermomarina]NMX23605.1 insulinase family protein [Dissulfurirhabdus thermomarina]